ncbi:epoxide hydrolase family protein [Bradyrhizobium erythrophlei]|jgi:microsomal epoxide hydrolase|uniref:Epoxide hydrolase n=1 Tax=Bradyrhizobium erythrophlei TaxID=1437360 RepID=A0A1M7TGJ0_9BRAD|nr:epoxide hydrolase family protein [Bradyrhizobium erythrophlei]SHN69862.1 epoxide hydrolase [Bradyrhizobium erythrophlei]
MTKPVPFTLHVADADIADLKARLARTRFPDSAPGEALSDPWAYGTDVAYLRSLVEYWRDGFDWRAEEAALNVFPQFRVPIDGIDLHYLRVEGKGENPMPLLLLHGWPGSVFEFLEIIPRLTDPARFGGDSSDAFTVIAPSLPGYGLSFKPGQKRYGVPEMADCVAALMHDVLGFSRFAAQGGDWGAGVTSRLGYAHAEKMIGIHVNFMMAAGRDPNAIQNPTEEEKRYLGELAHWTREGTGYQWIQGTRPQTLSFALTDSPAGLAAWIVEKFRAWSDCGGDVESAISRDQMLADISLYWFTGAIGSSFWPYYARLHGSAAILPPGETITVPTGYAQFPREILRPPRSIAERVFKNIRRWSVMEKGGHFAALEQPELLAHEVRAFFRELH